MPDGGIESAKGTMGGRYLFLFLGHLSLIVGAIGLLVPVMPTSPFVIIAAACYARSSERFYRALITNKYFGGDVRRWREHRCVQRRLKIASAFVLTIAFAVSAVFLVSPAWAQWTVGAMGFLAVVAVLYLPVCNE